MSPSEIALVDPSLESAETPVTTMDEANNALQMLSYVQRRRQAIIDDAQSRIDAIKAQAQKDIEPYETAERVFTKNLKSFIKKARRQIEVDGRRTVVLTFGTIGFRLPPPSLVLEKGFSEEDVIHWIRQKFPDEAELYIQTRASLRREELKKLMDEDSLARIGCRLDQKEQIVIEPAQDVAGSKEVA